jgi:hypothetical protein
MLNRRYLGWLITGAYAGPQGGFRAPDVAVLGAGRAREPATGPADEAARPAPGFVAADAMDSSRHGHRPITAGR